MTCPNCREGFTLPGEPTGVTSTEFNGAYCAAGLIPENGVASKRAIVFLTDGFGLPLINCKLMADDFAKRLGCDVWVPDYFAGKPLIGLDVLVLPDRAGVKMSIFDWIKFIFKSLPSIPAFLASRPSVADKRVHDFIKLLKEKKQYEKIGAIGYCYGGSTVIRLAGTQLIDSVVVCHPGSFSLEEVKKIRVPASWACAEEDLFFPDDLRLKSEASFAERKGDNKVDFEFQRYKGIQLIIFMLGTTHGFAARPNINILEVKEAHDKAREQAVNWFKKTLF
ncbi:dienelactone hydrolase endo-1,3,1,4-beta-D-glucanase [Crucibulum laeve]|uniref:Dienelactone hydrolase endo-1,3,1,4-beta-D-glucanase n=1 Tax=Crucibulum laeve TaxID=68775 RepID=A0A5C3M194_9AGAR|nr:dienelactone hydrolase endo-1,3,1,4-beta-D-glucanase [Crucibulum laeve]